MFHNAATLPLNDRQLNPDGVKRVVFHMPRNSFGFCGPVEPSPDRSGGVLKTSHRRLRRWEVKVFTRKVTRLTRSRRESDVAY